MFSSTASDRRVVTRVAASEQVQNTRFAAWLEPNNASVVSRNLWAVKTRAHREPTVGRVTLGEERRLNPFLRVRDPEFALMTLRRSAKLNLEKGKWYLKWRSLLARKSKADLYLHDDDESSRCVDAASSALAYLGPVPRCLSSERLTGVDYRRHGANDVELDEVVNTASLPLLPDQEAIVVMKRLNRLMGVWSAQHSHQVCPASPGATLWDLMCMLILLLRNPCLCLDVCITQLPPCCVHGTCVRRLTCSGHTSKRNALRSQMVQTDASVQHVQPPQCLVDA